MWAVEDLSWAAVQEGTGRQDNLREAAVLAPKDLVDLDLDVAAPTGLEDLEAHQVESRGIPFQEVPGGLLADLLGAEIRGEVVRKAGLQSSQ